MSLPWRNGSGSQGQVRSTSLADAAGDRPAGSENDSKLSKYRFRKVVDARKGDGTPVLLPASGPLESASSYHKFQKGTEVAERFFGTAPASTSVASLQVQIQKLKADKASLQADVSIAQRSQKVAAPSSLEQNPDRVTKADAIELAKLRAVSARLAEDNAELAAQLELKERPLGAGKPHKAEAADLTVVLRLEEDNRTLQKDNSVLAAELEHMNKIATYVGSKVAKVLVDARRANNHHAARVGELTRCNRKLECENQRLAAIIDRLNARGSEVFSDSASQLSENSLSLQREDLVRADSAGLVKRLEGQNRSLQREISLLAQDAGAHPDSQSTNSRSSGSTAGSTVERLPESSPHQGAVAEGMAAELDRTSAELAAALAALQQAEIARERAAGMAGRMEVLGREAKVGRELRDDNFRLEEALALSQQQVIELENEIEAMEEEAERLSEGVQRGMLAQSTLASTQQELAGLRAQMLTATDTADSHRLTIGRLEDSLHQAETQLESLKVKQIVLANEAALVPGLTAQVADLLNSVRQQEDLRIELQQEKHHQKELTTAAEMQWKSQAERQEKESRAATEALEKQVNYLQEKTRMLEHQAMLLKAVTEEVVELRRRVKSAERARPEGSPGEDCCLRREQSTQDGPGADTGIYGSDGCADYDGKLDAAQGHSSKACSAKNAQVYSPSEDSQDRQLPVARASGLDAAGCPAKTHPTTAQVPSAGTRGRALARQIKANGLWQHFTTQKGAVSKNISKDLRDVDELMTRTASQQAKSAWNAHAPSGDVCGFMTALGFAGFAAHESKDLSLSATLLRAEQATTADLAAGASAWDRAIAAAANSYITSWSS